ncbi:MAG TPA: hypothetical protein VGE74_29395 [Gemmata sp.]
MSTVYVQRDQGGAIMGVYALPQEGIAEEVADDSAPEVAAFLAPPALTPEQLAQRAIAALLSSADPAIVGVVALFRLAFTLLNDEREYRNADRIQEPEIIQRAAALLVGAAPAPAVG